MEPYQNMQLFRELVRCGSEVHTWCYDAEGDLLESNCPDEEVLSAAFSILGCHKRMMEHWRKHSSPMILGNSMGLTWGVAFEEMDGAPYRAWLIGPVFYSNVSVSGIREGFSAHIGAEVSMTWKHRFIDVLYQIPTVPHIVFSRSLLMLHYCLTGEHLGLSDLNVGSVPDTPEQSTSAASHDRYKIWSAEQALLQVVRNGDLDYQQALNTSMSLSNGVPVQSSDPLRKDKTSTIVFCSLVCRAAIEGGLSAEEAYSLGDAYIQSSENAQSVDELISIAQIMYGDFVCRVRKCRTNPKFSTAIQKCVDYIEAHLGDRIRAADLAAVAGYDFWPF